MHNPIEKYVDGVLNIKDKKNNKLLLNTTWWYLINNDIYTDPHYCDVDDKSFFDEWATYVDSLLVVDSTLSHERIVSLYNKCKTIVPETTPMLLYRHGFRDFSQFDIIIKPYMYFASLKSLIKEMKHNNDINIDIIENFHCFVNKESLNELYYNNVLAIFGELKITNPIIMIPEYIKLTNNTLYKLMSMGMNSVLACYKDILLRHKDYVMMFLEHFCVSIPEFERIVPKAWICLYTQNSREMTKEMFDEVEDKETFIKLYMEINGPDIPEYMLINDEIERMVHHADEYDYP